MKIMKLKKGGRFMARWPDTQYYYWSTLIEQAGDNWKVQFDDGTIAEVKPTDLHESLPADARNRVGRVTRSSPTKNLKRPEEITKSPSRKSPSRKVRKLFTEEDNIKLAAELSTAIAETSATPGDPDARPPSSRERSVSVSKETEEEKHTTSDVRSSQFKRSDSVTRGTKDDPPGTSDVRSSLFKRSDSVTKGTKDDPPDTADVRQSPSRPSISVTIQNENLKGGVAEVRPSPSKSSYTMEVQKESMTHNMTRYTESYQDRDLRRQLWKEGSVGSADPRSLPSRRSASPLRQRENLTHDVKTYVESFADKDFRRQLFQKEGSIGSSNLRPSPFRGPDSLLTERGKMTSGSAILRPSPIRGSASLLTERGKMTSGSANLRPSPFRGPDSLLTERGKMTSGSAILRPSPIRGSDSLLTERGKMTSDLRKYTESYLDRDFRKQLGREGSVGSTGILPSPYRRSVSVTKENKNLTRGISFKTKYSLEDYEKRHLNKFPMEFGGRFGAFLLILLLPLYIMSVFVFNLVPETTKFEVSFPKQLLLTPQVAFGVIMLLFFQATLTILPIGAVVSGPLTKLGIFSMRCNGIFAVVLTLILTSAACYFEREVAGIVVSVYTEAAVSAMLLGIILALILYKRGSKLPISYLNPYGSSGFKLYDFWMGREITPCVRKFNIKLILHRFSLIIAITLNVLIVAKAYMEGEKEDLLKSLMISTVLQSLYCLHFLFHEDIYLYSFLALSEGVGYMITVGFMTFPFILTLTTKVILDYRLKASLAEMCIALFGYTVGYLLLESSSNRKTLSVRDPITSVWKMKVVPEWSPSVHTRAYLGEIIIYWAFAMLAGTTYLGLFMIPAAFTLSVLSRAFREYTRSVAYQRDLVNLKQF